MLKRWVCGVGAAGLLFGCGSDDGGSGVDANGPEVLEESSEEPAGDNCEYGGTALHSGEDENGDGELQNREISDTEYECNDPPQDGGADAEGTETRLLITQLDVGDENCPGGGTQMDRGTDSNSNGELDAAEVESTDYICAPVLEPETLLVITTLEVGDIECPGGGSKLERGLDDDGDGEISEEEVDSTDLLCSEVAATPTLARAKDLPVGDEGCPDGGVAVVTGPDTDGDGLLSDAEVTATSLVCDSPDLVISCAVPTVWNEEISGCERLTDWAGEDLAGSTLASEYLAGIDFTGADLSDANLSFAELRDANLSDARLDGADLTGAALVGTNLTGAVLDGADLTGVDLSGAVLDGISAIQLVACPSILPEGWRCPDLGASGLSLTWPGMSLEGFDLTGAVLTHDDLHGLQPIGIAACPTELPDGWACTELGDLGTSLLGPGVDLGGLELPAVDLSEVPSLEGASWVGANLAGATFGDGASLCWSDFGGANLTGASFGANTELCYANFSDANLTDVTFGAGTDLSFVVIKRAELTGADFSLATLEGVHALGLLSCPLALPENFSCVETLEAGRSLVGPGADLSGANLGGADLSALNLSGANLESAYLDGANLTGTVLTGAQLVGIRASGLTGCTEQLPSEYRCVHQALVGPAVDLAGVDLSGANLRELDLSFSNFSGANLSTADLGGSDLSFADLSGATVEGTLAVETLWNETTCPDGGLSDDAEDERCF